MNETSVTRAGKCGEESNTAIRRSLTYWNSWLIDILWNGNCW